MTVATEILGEALARDRARVDDLLRRHRDDADALELVQWGYVLLEPARGLTSADRLGGLNARAVASGDVLLDEDVGGVWGHWRPRR